MCYIINSKSPASQELSLSPLPEYEEGHSQQFSYQRQLLDIIRSLLKQIRQNLEAENAQFEHQGFILNLWQWSQRVNRKACSSSMLYYYTRKLEMKPPIRLPVEVFTKNKRFDLYQSSDLSPKDYESRSVVPLLKSNRKEMVSCEKVGSYSRRKVMRERHSSLPILKIGWKRLRWGMLLVQIYLFFFSNCQCYYIFCWLLRYQRYLVMNSAGKQWLSANSSSSSSYTYTLSPSSSSNTCSSFSSLCRISALSIREILRYTSFTFLSKACLSAQAASRKLCISCKCFQLTSEADSIDLTELSILLTDILSSSKWFWSPQWLFLTCWTD